MPSQHSTDLPPGSTRPSILKNRNSDASQISNSDKSRNSSSKTVVIRVPLLRYEIEDQEGLGPCSLLDSLTIREADEDPSKGDSSPVSDVTYYDAPHNHTIYTHNSLDPSDSSPGTEADGGGDVVDDEVNCSSNSNDMGPELEFPLDGYSAVEQSFKAKARKQAEASGKPFEWPERPVHGDGTATYLPHEQWLAATRKQRLSQGTEVARWYKDERGPSIWRRARANYANQAMRKSSTNIGEVDLEKLKAGSSEEVDDTESSPPARFSLRRSEPNSNFNSLQNPISDHSDADDESDRENDLEANENHGDHSESESEDDCVSMALIIRKQTTRKPLHKLVIGARSGTPELSWSIGSSSPPSSPFSTKFGPISRVETTGSASGTEREISLRPRKAPASAKSGFYIGSSDEEDSEEDENSD